MCGPWCEGRAFAGGGSVPGLNRRSVLGVAAVGAAAFALRPFVAVAAEETAGDAIAPLPVQEVAPGLFVYQAPYELADARNQGAVANVGFIVGRDAVAVFDTGNSLVAGRRLRAAVREKTALPIRFVIFTHMHPDHVLGAAAFAEDKPEIVASAKLPRALAARADTYLEAGARAIGPAFAGTVAVEPTRVVTGSDAIDLGARRLTLTTHPTAHTDNDLSLFDTETGTLVLGDLLFLGHVPSIDGSTLGWLAVLDTIAQRTDVRRVVPGHGPAVVDFPAGLGPEKAYLERLVADDRALIKAGGDIAEAPERAGISERGKWALFDEFNPRNAITTFHELEWE